MCRVAHMLPANPGDTAEVTSRSAPIWGRVTSNQALVPLAAFEAMFIITALGSSVFLTSPPLENLARQSIVTGLNGLGQLFVVLTGNIDLSIRATVGFANLVSADRTSAFRQRSSCHWCCSSAWRSVP